MERPNPSTSPRRPELRLISAWKPLVLEGWWGARTGGVLPQQRCSSLPSVRGSLGLKAGAGWLVPTWHLPVPPWFLLSPSHQPSHLMLFLSLF